jgi:hypothetical protein
MTMLLNQLLVIAAAIAAYAIANPACAQISNPPRNPVRTAAFERTESTATVQAVQFKRRPARVGDKTEQDILLKSKMSTVHRQSNKLHEKTHVEMEARQKREVTVKAVHDGRASTVLVHYHGAGMVVESRGENAESEDKAEPIVGKAYLCCREGGLKGNLRVTYEDGTLPPMDEYEIVSRHMETIGQANPLADFLAGRTVKIGETLEVPRQVAAKLLNLDFEFGEMSRFDLKLETTEQKDGLLHAVFLALIEAESSGSSQMRMQVEGPLVVEANSCRAVNVDLIGPIGMSETRGSYSTVYQVIGTGQLRMSIESKYNDAKR